MKENLLFSVAKFTISNIFLLGFFIANIPVNAQCTSVAFSSFNCEQAAVDLINSYTAPHQVNFSERAMASDIYYLQAQNVDFLDDFDNSQIMNAAYGAGNWTKGIYETLDPANVFVSSTTVIFMDGSGDQVTAFQDFLTANTTLIENWVTNGGVILINAAPSPGSPTVDVGFNGTQIVSNTFIAAADVVNTNFPAFVGPNTPTVTPMGGAFYANASVQGPGLTTIMEDVLNPSNLVLAEKDMGFGKVLFGGMTRNSFHVPFTESRNWRINLFIYMFDSVIQEPTIECPDDITMGSDADECGAVVTFDSATAEDIQDGTLTTTQTQGPASGQVFPLGETTVTFSATDNDNNTVECSFTVTVTDDVAPTVLTQNINVSLDDDGNASVAINDIDDGSFDNCGIDALSLDLTNFSCNDLGDNVVTLTATDVNGNTASQTAVVTVVDDVLPTISAQDITVILDNNGAVTVDPNQVDDGSADNCGIESLSVNPAVFTCDDIGDNTSVFTVTDESGNEATANIIITVVDNQSPTVSAQNTSVVLNANGVATIIPQDIDNGSFDNCSTIDFSLDISSFTCDDVGENTVTLTGTDPSGNSSSATSIVTVIDNLPPTIIANGLTLELDENGVASLDANALNAGSFDNCGIAEVSVDNENFDCDNVGANTVILSVTDINGNTSTTTVEITVEDNLMPDFDTGTLPVDQTVNYTTDNGYEIPDYTQTITGTDNCTNVDISQSITAGTIVEMGVYTVTITITDASGNAQTYTFELTVEEDLAIQDVDGIEFTIYPNPTQGQLTITSEDPITNIQLFDLTGKQLQFETSQNLDVSMLQAGIYIIKVESNERSALNRFIKN